MRTLLLLGLALLVFACWLDYRATAACEASGGHIISRTSVGTGISSNGSVAVIPVTMDLCLTADGRVLE